MLEIQVGLIRATFFLNLNFTADVIVIEQYLFKKSTEFLVHNILLKINFDRPTLVGCPITFRHKKQCWPIREPLQPLITLN